MFAIILLAGEGYINECCKTRLQRFSATTYSCDLLPVNEALWTTIRKHEVMNTACGNTGPEGVNNLNIPRSTRRRS